MGARIIRHAIRCMSCRRVIEPGTKAWDMDGGLIHDVCPEVSA